MMVFQCKRCKKYFWMNITFRAPISEEDALKRIEIDNGPLGELMKVYAEMEQINYYNTFGYLEDLSLKERICWRML